MTSPIPPNWLDHSLYAQRWLARFPQWQEAQAQGALIACIQQWLAEAQAHVHDEAALMRTLRLLRQRCLIEIMRRDLQGQASLLEVTEALSFLADQCIALALRCSHHLQAERYGQPADNDALMVVAMGKLGGLELNASSDIDLVFVHQNAGETQGGQGGKTPGKRQSHSEFFTQVGRRVIRILSEVTEDGFVFRVDMRLRPNGDSGPLVVHLDMLEEYFMVQGREWERYAWVKARVANQALEAEHSASFNQGVQALFGIVRPFVYRKYLDYGAIRAMRSLHAQIRDEVNKREHQHPGTVHVKLGRGGIREIEFIAQVFQLIRGGREPVLQQRRTVDVLGTCAQMGLITLDAYDELHQAYVFLRNLEHRLQYVEDAQTHRLPSSPEALAPIARAMGFANTEAFLVALEAHRRAVSNHFDAVFADKQTDNTQSLALPWKPEQLAPFSEPEAAQQRYQDWVESSRYRTLPQGHRERVDRLMPALLANATQSQNPDQAWRHCCDLIECISRRGAYLSLLDEYPMARNRVTRMLAASPWAAQFLIRHPLLLDELLDNQTLMATPQLELWRTQLFDALQRTRTPTGSMDVERQMDLVREQHHAQLFRILAQDLEGQASVETVSDWLSELTDHTLDVVLQTVWRQLPKRHTEQPKFAIVAYGKLGGKELGYASDLDLIFLYDDIHPDANEVYANLAKRINRWLSTPTAAGILFETDFRLRPNGEAGLIVSSFASFASYQRREGGVGAWFWEHQALSRARFCVGDKALGQAFEALRDEILRLPRDWPSVQEEVKTMRQKMRDAHPNLTPLFDLKHDPGGMVDVEFMVQALVLGHAHKHPALTANKGNIALLHKAGELGLIPADQASWVADAYRELRAKQHAMRLGGAENTRTQDPYLVVLRKPIMELWGEVLG